MFKSAYDTTPCRDYVLTKIKAALESNLHVYGLDGVHFKMLEHPVAKNAHPVIIVLPSPMEIPTFAHPITVELPNGGQYLVIDGRPFMRMRPDHTSYVSSQLDFNTLRNCAVAEWCAVKNGDDALLGLSNIHITVFIRWVSDAIGRRLTLSPEHQIRLTILIGIYYLGLYMPNTFTDFQKLEEKNMVRMATQISRATFLRVEDILSTMDEVGEFSNTISGLAEMLRKHGNSSRFDQVNVPFIYSVMYASGSWFGYNKNEIVAVAMEHPPTFLGMLLSAIDERGYKDTALGRLAKTYNRGDAATTFVTQFWHMPV